MTPDYVNAWLRKCKANPFQHEAIAVPHVTCMDGLTLSVQASQSHYCQPRENKGPWHKVEIGFPSEYIPEIVEWAERWDTEPFNGVTDFKCVYPYVPTDVVNEVIHKHGGIYTPFNDALSRTESNVG